ncbi:hypothetical protein K9L05_03620 [Candidatus Babeliales bacterium]|nr:hypothetical protein [Candidatus Babeliales bacterium]MCF7899706.1 hypothetical protein [Candidatus Babeliales bacterium]
MNSCIEKLLTIITESDIEEHIIKDVEVLGAKGYTITSVLGKGERGKRNAIWSNNSNIKIEIISDSEICNNIVQHLQNNYIKNYAMIFFIAEVNIFR